MQPLNPIEIRLKSIEIWFHMNSLFFLSASQAFRMSLLLALWPVTNKAFPSYPIIPLPLPQLVALSLSLQPPSPSLFTPFLLPSSYPLSVVSTFHALWRNAMYLYVGVHPNRHPAMDLIVGYAFPIMCGLNTCFSATGCVFLGFRWYVGSTVSRFAPNVGLHFFFWQNLNPSEPLNCRFGPVFWF